MTLTAVLLPFLEIPGFVLVSAWIGVIPMLALVVTGVIVGIMVLQRVGMNALVNLRLALARGEEPGHTLIDAACFALGGFLLTIPGFISDIIALALFLPWTRNYLLRRAAGHFDVHIYGRGFGAGGEPRPGGGVIEGEYSVVDSDLPDSAPPRLKDGSSGQ
ncbi:FxsA family protein [Dongia sedimenti]|uniref:FxsA family protein n=1 Tax=Dongia sedimenti TaxID=3064282 RepID=A0ABU0YN30_9PROT|nr:FxsA family protein [Rhodospirillaceae bacterium R-7]